MKRKQSNDVPLLAKSLDSRRGTPWSSAMNLTAAAVGSGILTLPFAFACSGTTLGVIVLLVLAIVSATSLSYLVEIGRATKLTSFEHNAEHFLGPAGGSIFNGLFTLLLLMVLMAYTRVAVELLTSFLQQQFGHSWYFEEFPVGAACVLAMYFVVMCSKSLHALRVTSSMALLCQGYFLVLLFYRGVETAMRAAGGSSPEAGGVAAAVVPASSRFWLAPPLFMSAVLCHFNIYDVDTEMRPEYRSKVVSVCYAVMVGIALLNIAVGATGYFVFGDAVSGDVLQNFPPDRSVQLARFLLGLTNVFRIPLVVGPAHKAVRHLLRFGPPLASSRATRGTGAALAQHAAEVAILMLSGLYASMKLPLERMLGLAGCTCGTLTCIAFPTLMYIQYMRQTPSVASARSYAVAALMLCISAAVMLTGLVANLL